MTIDRRLEQSMPAILAELGGGVTSDYGELVLQRTARTRQRPGWLVTERRVRGFAIPPITGQRMAPALGVLMLLLALAAAAVYIGTRPRLPAPFGPARNGSIVFSSGGDLFTGTPDGVETALVTGPEIDFDPYYSRDGTRVAFFRQFGEDAGALTDIMVMDADGTGLTRITAAPLQEIPWNTTWTPDGTRIIVQTSERLDGRLLSFDATREGPPLAIDHAARQLDLRIDSFALQPPDGRHILFTGQSGSLTGLFLMDSDGSGLTTLIQPYLAMLPDNLGEYWNHRTDIKDLRNPIWSPDGKHIVVQQDDGAPGSGQLRLFILDPDGGDRHAITNPGGDSIDGNAAWSPDGTRIAFVRYDAVAQAWVYAVLRVADGKVTITGPQIPDGRDPEDWSPGAPIIGWAPDSTMVFAIERGGSRQSYLLDPDGGEQETLPWHVETPQSWGLQGLNSLDLGAWQRKASP